MFEHRLCAMSDDMAQILWDNGFVPFGDQHGIQGREQIGRGVDQGSVEVENDGRGCGHR
jgi:hypothetical protein